MGRFYLLILAVLCLFLSCSGAHRAKKIKKYIQNEEISLRTAPDSILFHYIGCGGLLIRREDQALLLDPFFSNIGPLLMVPFKKLKPQESLINQFFLKNFKNSKDRKGIIRSTLITHGHYDHLGDLPFLYQHHLDIEQSPVICNRTVKHLLAPTEIGRKSPEQIRVIPPQKEPTANRWMYTKDRRIRVWPVAVDHAPHWLGINLAPSKELKKDHKRFPRKGLGMPDGQNYSFLIDFMDKEKRIACRIYSQAGSATEVQSGFLPDSVLREKQIDVLLLCVASFDQVEGYPEQLIDYIRPGQIILTHWENFFCPIAALKKKPRTVPATKVHRFIARLERHLADIGFKCDFVLPNVDTRMWW